MKQQQIELLTLRYLRGKSHGTGQKGKEGSDLEGLHGNNNKYLLETFEADERFVQRGSACDRSASIFNLPFSTLPSLYTSRGYYYFSSSFQKDRTSKDRINFRVF